MRYPPGPRARRVTAHLATLTAATLTATTLIAGTLLATVPAALPARAASASPPGQVSLCRRYQHVTVAAAQGARFVVKNDNYGGRHRECLVVQKGSPNFTVTRSPVPAWHRKPRAYPFILRGCSWGTCSPDSGLPVQVSAMQRPMASWATTQVPHGRWDAAFDIWFGTQPMTTGQADGAELMIWLSARHVPVPPGTPVVRVAHARWYLLSGPACHGGTCWNYVQFRRVRPVTSVTNLPLSPFFRRAEARGWVKPGWWLENIEAGFELWQGGKGLATDSFWAQP